MENNYTLRSVRYMLDLSDAKMVEVIGLTGLDVDLQEMQKWLKKEDDPEYKECPDQVMAQFLNGLIFFKRGKDNRFPAPSIEPVITNNIVMKKLRVAFALQDTDIQEIFVSVSFNVTKPELSAIFRKPGTKNYRDCGDQLLRNFLKGLTLRIRGNS